MPSTTLLCDRWWRNQTFVNVTIEWWVVWIALPHRKPWRFRRGQNKWRRRRWCIWAEACNLTECRRLRIWRRRLKLRFLSYTVDYILLSAKKILIQSCNCTKSKLYLEYSLCVEWFRLQQIKSLFVQHPCHHRRVVWDVWHHHHLHHRFHHTTTVFGCPARHCYSQHHRCWDC